MFDSSKSLLCVVVCCGLVLGACEMRAPKPIGPKGTRAPIKKTEKQLDDAVPKPPAEPILVLPKQASKAPNSIPLLVMLHGYGSNHKDLVSLGRLARKMNWASLSVPAPVVMGSMRFSWDKNQPERTHRYLQSILKRWQASHPALKTAQVYLAGFSQGGLHSSLVTTLYPEKYLGVLAISPAGWSTVPESFKQTTVRPICMVGGTAEKARYRKTFKALASALKKSKWPVEVYEHTQGHHFPSNWQGYFTRCFQHMRQ